MDSLLTAQITSIMLAAILSFLFSIETQCESVRVGVNVLFYVCKCVHMLERALYEILAGTIHSFWIKNVYTEISLVIAGYEYFWF